MQLCAAPWKTRQVGWSCRIRQTNAVCATSNAPGPDSTVATTAAFRVSHYFRSRSGSGSCAQGRLRRSHGSTSASNLLTQCMTRICRRASSTAPRKTLYTMDSPCQPSQAMQSDNKGQKTGTLHQQRTGGIPNLAMVASNVLPMLRCPFASESQRFSRQSPLRTARVASQTTQRHHCDMEHLDLTRVKRQTRALHWQPFAMLPACKCDVALQELELSTRSWNCISRGR